MVKIILCYINIYSHLIYKIKLKQLFFDTSQNQQITHDSQRGCLLLSSVLYIACISFITLFVQIEKKVKINKKLFHQTFIVVVRYSFCTVHTVQERQERLPFLNCTVYKEGGMASIMLHLSTNTLGIHCQRLNYLGAF